MSDSISLVANIGPRLAPRNRIKALNNTALPRAAPAFLLTNEMFTGTTNAIPATKRRLQRITIMDEELIPITNNPMDATNKALRSDKIIPNLFEIFPAKIDISILMIPNARTYKISCSVNPNFSDAK